MNRFASESGITDECGRAVPLASVSMGEDELPSRHRRRQCGVAHECQHEQHSGRRYGTVARSVNRHRHRCRCRYAVSSTPRGVGRLPTATRDDSGPSDVMSRGHRIPGARAGVGVGIGAHLREAVFDWVRSRHADLCEQDRRRHYLLLFHIGPGLLPLCPRG